MRISVKKLAARRRLDTRSKIGRKVASIIIPWEIQLAKLTEEKVRLKSKIRKLSKEINEIESELEKLRGSLNGSSEKEKDTIERISKRISKLRRQLGEKRKKFIDDIIRLKKLEEEIKYVKKHVRGTIEAVFR